MSTLLDILLSGLFHAGVLFLVAGGLQLVFGVQKIVNLACGSFYALGAYAGVTAVTWAMAQGVPGYWLLPLLLGSGLLLGVVGPVIERVLRYVYNREEGFQLLLTFALLLLSQDIFRFIWGATPKTLGNMSLIYGQTTLGPTSIPTYKILVIVASIAIAIALGWLLQKTKFGRIVRATAENRNMSEAVGISTGHVTVIVFTLGTILGTVGGALVVPTAAASLDMMVELVVEAFAVVVIGGLGSMRGALVGALVVGLIRSLAVFFYAELEILSIYLIVIAVLIFRPTGLFGKPIE
ncbi:branched-chain amino acid ABC transporter permease [Lacisediminimonas sp.]|uniref:branched-chain amino acid ABC transporter permease n=1 Tax=Lacisediminimonas sp. TaxID=3060582 RepID=UPI00272C1B8F|nr:branched-chain amino acid ABC transporter permease [Lacisediminimonas sp.]